MKDTNKIPVSIYTLIYNVTTDTLFFFPYKRKFRLTSFFYQTEYNNDIYYMRILTPSLTFATRIFKRRVIQDLLKSGNLEGAKAVGRARYSHPDDRETCMGTYIPPDTPDPHREVDWNDTKLWGKRSKVSTGPWWTF